MSKVAASTSSTRSILFAADQRAHDLFALGFRALAHPGGELRKTIAGLRDFGTVAILTGRLVLAGDRGALLRRRHGVLRISREIGLEGIAGRRDEDLQVRGLHFRKGLDVDERPASLGELLHAAGIDALLSFEDAPQL